MASIYHIVAIRVNETSWAHVWRLRFLYLGTGYDTNHSFFWYLDGYSGYHQAPIHPNDQSRTTFTCPYDTFANKQMSFGLCNALASF
jgi:hypothetical protein